jgi:teichuronic acid biosynthesis glycosyltransferase TuaC
MKVLFVSSGNAKNGISPIIFNQAQSLRKHGISIDFFTIKGKGFLSYFRHIFILRKYLKTNKFDIIHAHYSNCLIVSYYSKKNEKLGISFMGTDILKRKSLGQKLISTVSIWLARKKASFVVVKTKQMAEVVNHLGIYIISNGVNLSDFYPIPKEEARKYLNIDPSIKLIVFVANPSRPEKNYTLAQKAYKILFSKYENSLLNTVFDKPKELLKYYYSAADVLLVTSFHEGGINVVKEAMACNCPIVSTDVGDVKDVIKEVEGCFICNFDPVDVSTKIEKAFIFDKRTVGRMIIEESNMDSDSVAKKIIEIYNTILQ